MTSTRNPFRRVLAVSAVGLVAAVSLAAGVSVASAAPGAPSIDSPASPFATTSTTLMVSGSLAEGLDQDVTVWIDDDGARSVGCVDLLTYADTNYSCEVTFPGPGKYELTATAVDVLDPEQVPSPPSNAVTVTVGDTTPAEFTSHTGSSIEWATLLPTFSGVGPALGSVRIEISFNPGDGSGEQIIDYCTVDEVSRSGAWSCVPTITPAWGWGQYVYFEVFGTDVTGAPTSAADDDDIGGTMVAPPPVTSITPGPASIAVESSGAPFTDLRVELYSVEVIPGEPYQFGFVGDDCVVAGNPPATVNCAFTGLAAGLWSIYTVQTSEGEGGGEGEGEGAGDTQLLDDYVLIPSTPTLTATVTAERTVRLSGTGEPGQRVIARTAAGADVCAVIVNSGGVWQCTVAPGAGSFSYRALQQSVNFVADPDSVPGYARSFDGFSALTPVRSVTVPPAPPVAPPTTIIATPLSWALSGVDGSPLTPGQVLQLSADGLPPGTVVDVEIRSTPRALGSAVADAAGAIALVVTVPADLEPGDHTLVATATPPGGQPSALSFPVTVLSAPPADDSSTAGGDQRESDGSETDAAYSGAVSPAGERADPAAPSAISDSIPTIDRIFRTPLLLVISGGLALALLLLVAFPAELLNSTLASNTQRLGRWYAAVERRIDRATEWFTQVTRSRAIAAALLVVITSLVFGFVDPEYGFDPVSIRMTVSLAIGLFIVTYVSSWISGAIVRRVWNVETQVSLQPAALLFAVIGVVVARLLDFSPGFLIGLVIGLDILSRVEAGMRVRAILTSIGAIVGLSVLAWVGYSVMVAASTGEPDVLELLISDALIATTAEGLTAALAALLPLGFLDGHEVFRRSKVLWAGVFAAVATIFALIVLPTAEAETGDVADVGFWMLVMVIFAVVTLTLWAVLQFVGRNDDADGEADQDGGAQQPLEVSR